MRAQNKDRAFPGRSTAAGTEARRGSLDVCWGFCCCVFLLPYNAEDKKAPRRENFSADFVDDGEAYRWLCYRRDLSKATILVIFLVCVSVVVEKIGSKFIHPSGCVFFCVILLYGICIGT